MPMAWIWEADNLIEDNFYSILRCISNCRSYNDRDHVLLANLLPQTSKICSDNQNMALHCHNSSITICLSTLDSLFLWRRIFLHRPDGFPCLPGISTSCKFDTVNKCDDLNWQRYSGVTRFIGTSQDIITSSEDCN